MLAYVDSYAGLIPCRIVRVDDWADGSCQARVTFTATRGPYERGDTQTFNLRRVVPRTSIKRRKYSTLIMPYSWPEIAAKLGQITNALCA